MKKTLVSIGILCTLLTYSQTKKDSTGQKDIKEVVITAKKPTVENKVDRTVFNVANSSILAGNTTWDVLRMTPLVSIDNNDAIKAEGETVIVYINDRKSVFTGKQLKEYLKTIPAENLMKIEVITSPSARYESAGAVINIVLKKLENEGIKGNVTFTNTQNRKNSQYSNLNLNYHKKNFTQTFAGGYDNNITVIKSYNENLFFATKSLTKINTEEIEKTKSPSFSSTSEFEINPKNNIGFIAEYSHINRNSSSYAIGETYENNIQKNNYIQNQNLDGFNRNLGSNLFYKYYDKEKNKILDIIIGLNYNSVSDTNNFISKLSDTTNPSGTKIIANNHNREYYLKIDYSQPIGKSEDRIEFGGKIDFKNTTIPYDYLITPGNQWQNNNFQYLENLNSIYANFSKKFFKKLETRIGIRLENISYKINENGGNTEKTNSYNTLLPDALIKYTFSDNYNISASYRHNIWRPFNSDFNPFLLPSNNGTFFRGNMDLQPNPSDRIAVKFGFYKKYFLSASYWFTNKDYWNTFLIEDGKTITTPQNFDGKVKRYYIFLSTNQSLLKNKLNLNVDFGVQYLDNSDFNKKNGLNSKNYITNLNGSSNISYTNLFNKNININAWVGFFTQNNGNSYANKPNTFHNISVTKIFTKTEMEVTLRLNNIFMRPNFDNTTYSPIGSFRNSNYLDWYGLSLTLVKRFGNQKVKENTKTNVEKDSGGAK